MPKHAYTYTHIRLLPMHVTHEHIHAFIATLCIHIYTYMHTYTHRQYYTKVSKEALVRALTSKPRRLPLLAHCLLRPITPTPPKPCLSTHIAPLHIYTYTPQAILNYFYTLTIISTKTEIN
jgi:hypothetical protein